MIVRMQVVGLLKKQSTNFNFQHNQQLIFFLFSFLPITQTYLIIQVSINYVERKTSLLHFLPFFGCLQGKFVIGVNLISHDVLFFLQSTEKRKSLLFSFEPKYERNHFFISALTSKNGPNQKNYYINQGVFNIIDTFIFFYLTYFRSLGQKSKNNFVRFLV